VSAVTAEGERDESYGDEEGRRFLGAFEQSSRVFDLVLQSDGRLLLAGFVQLPGNHSDVFLVRLLPDGEFDDSFAGNGLRRVPFDVVPEGSDIAYATTLSAGKLVAVGRAEANLLTGASRWAILRTENALVFRDGFERGSAGGWAGN
jgi:hypothetical protein